MNRCFVLFAPLLLFALLAVHFTPGSGQCTLFPAANVSKFCPDFFPDGIYYPTGVSILNLTPPDPVSLYNALVALACKHCHSFMSYELACSMLYSLYFGNCAENTTVGSTFKTPCRTACQTIANDCRNLTLQTPGFLDCGTSPTSSSYLTCPNPADLSCCQQFTGGNICNPPSFLNQSTGGVPNWVWIFIIGGGGIVLIIIGIGVFIYFRLQREDVLELINPCKWCECCPYYYDL